MQASQQLNSTRSFSSKLLKLSFCDRLISSPEWCIRYWLRWEKRESNLPAVWRGEIAWTATCVLGQAQQLLRKTTLVQAVVLWLNINTKPKNRTFFPLCFNKVQNCYQIGQNRNQAIKWLKEKPGFSVGGQGPSDLKKKNNSIKS